MYLSNVTRSPQIISRRQCVNLIFEIGGWKGYAYSLAALFSAVTIADKWAASRDYSCELAHVALVVGTKLEDDFIYTTAQAADETSNYMVYLMEREMFQLIGYRRVPIPLFNLMTIPMVINSESKSLNPIFEFVIKDIMLNPILLEVNPLTLILGLTLLARRNKLRATRQRRYSILKRILHQLAREYELKVSHVVRAYITLRQSTIV